MNQLDLFGAGAAGPSRMSPAAPDAGKHLARRSDPSTSRQSARDVAAKLSRHHATVWLAINQMVFPERGGNVATCKSEGGEMVAIPLGSSSYTAREIAVYAKERIDPNASIETLRKRVSELARPGGLELLKPAMTAPCLVTGKQAMAFGIAQKRS